MRTWVERASTALAAGERRLRIAERALVFAIPIAFFVLGILRARPFVDDVPLDRFVGDDWWTYKTYAHIIGQEGLAMPSVGPYVGKVHGFLYSYFVAGIFALFGENTSYVYVVQSFLLGCAVSLLSAPFRNRMTRAGSIALVLGLTVVLYIDFFRSLTFLLLSETLSIFLIGSFFWTYWRAFQGRSMTLAALSGLVLGLAVLSRTSIVASALGALAVTALYAVVRRRSVPLSLVCAMAVGFVVAMALFPLREYAATGRAEFEIITSTSDWGFPPASILPFIDHVGRRVLFIFGFPGLLAEEYRVRPHWLLAWLGVLAYLLSRVTWRLPLSMWEAALVVFIAFYVGPISLFGNAAVYGGRYVALVVPLAMLLAALVLDEWLTGARQRRGATQAVSSSTA